VRIEVADRGEEQPLVSAAALDIGWLHRNGVEPGRSTLLENAVKEVVWPDDGRRVFAWAGCEHGSFRAIRSYLRQDRKLERDRHMAVAYWRRGFDGDTARRNED